MNSSAELDATYYGFIGSTYDALILFEACISGQIKHVSRRPHDREREHVIQSGRVFIYEENTSGIKRWTDGISWSPSRILGNFLIYRQLVKAFGPGEKKKAIKKAKSGPSGIAKTSQSNSHGRHKETLFPNLGQIPATGGTYGRAGTINAETERALIGSLTDSYDFLEDGLVKKTISVTCDDVTHHLVSYYTIADAISQKFLVPSRDPRFANTHPRATLLTSQNFRSPIEDIDPMDRSMYPRNRYEMTHNAIHSPLPLLATGPLANSGYSGVAASIYHTNYSLPITSTTYENSQPGYASTLNYPNHYTPAPVVYPAPPRPDQCNGDYRERYASVSSGSDGSRAPMPTASNVQRESSVFHRRDSEDSGVSMSMDKVIKETSYSQVQNSYFGFPRENILSHQTSAAHRALPSLSQADFGRQTLHDRSSMNGPSYRIALSVDSKDLWQMGNASAGHGHYQQA